MNAASAMFWLVDASGRDTFLSNRLRIQQPQLAFKAWKRHRFNIRRVDDPALPETL